MNVKAVRELTRLMRDYDLVELEVKCADLEVRLSKGSAQQPALAAAPVAASAPAAAVPADPAPAAAAVAAEDDFAGCREVTSPIPGTVYLKPDPDKPNFAKVGDRIEDGQVVCLVEAMKVFNEVKAEGVSGVVRKVCVDDAQAVEYGTVLFLVG